jgi:hypothetical protein
MTFNITAASLTKHGVARGIEKQECHDLLQQAYEHNLVQFGENVQQQVNFICNCCGCCCEAMIAARRFAILNPVQRSAAGEFYLQLLRLLLRGNDCCSPFCHSQPGAHHELHPGH